MSNAIAAPSTATPTAASTEAADLKEFQGMLGQRMLMSMQQSQQAMSKSMNKLTEQVKASMQDEE